MKDCHECVATTNDGFVLIFGNTLHVQRFQNKAILDNKKLFVKALKISSSGINCVTDIDG